MSAGDSAQITRLLQAAGQGDADAMRELAPLVYQHMRRIARRQMADEGRALTLSTTALVHEAWLELCGGETREWGDQAHFLRYAATAMRHILIDHARRRGAARRGGGAEHLDLDALPMAGALADDGLLALDEALDSLARINPRLAQVVELRFFAGLEVDQVAEALSIHSRSVVRDWRKARAILGQLLETNDLAG